jgi:uncharacterized membrane protein
MAVEQERRAAHELTEIETGRLQPFSDAVFAVASTLLVLTLVVPELRGLPSQGTAAQLAEALGGEWPCYLAFVTSFGTILIM